MRLAFLTVLAVFGFVLSLAAQAGQAPESFADLAEKLLPAVVNISSTQKLEPTPQMPDMPQFPHFPPGSPFEDFFEEFMGRPDQGMPALPPASLGSGFVIDAAQGYIITNNHVISDAEEVRVTFHDDETLEAEIVGRDEKTDLAVLKIDPEAKALVAADFGDSSVLRVGDWVLAIGNPFGLGGTVTAGIVSARQRDINAGPYDDFIQTDASINRGNSGGPMFDLSGKVIGINTAIFSPSGGSVGIGFAIPSALAEPVIDQIIKYGRTRRGWLGVRIQTVTDEIAESLGLEKAVGALVASATADGPATKAGVQMGDVILRFNGQEVETMRALPRIVAETEIGLDVELVVWRDGAEVALNVQIGELEKAEENGLLAQAPTDEKNTAPGKKGVELTALGLTIETLTDALRQEYGLNAEAEGVLVTKVEAGSAAAAKGLIEGDVIVELNQVPALQAKDASKALKAAQKEGKGSVLLLINREGNIRFVALKLKAKE